MIYPKTRGAGYPDRAKPSFFIDEIEKAVKAALEAIPPLSEEQKCILGQAEIALRTKNAYKTKKTPEDGFKALQKGMDEAKKHGREDQAILMFNWASVQIERGKLGYWQKLIVEKKEAEAAR